MGARDEEWRSTISCINIFNDEAAYSRDCIFNLSNQRVWSDNILWWTTIHKYQQTFSANIWTGIVGDYVVGPYILPDNLIGAIPHLLGTSASPFVVGYLANYPERHVVYATPAHFFSMIRHLYNTTFPGRWIGHDKLLVWLPRSLDLNPRICSSGGT